MPHRKILVVEDASAVAQTLTLILRHEGYYAATAHSGEDAVWLARSFQPDLVVGDVEMGTVDGVEAAMEIRRFLPHCEVLFVSGTATWEDYLAKARAEGYGFELLAKPIPPPELLAKISQTLSSPGRQRVRLKLIRGYLGSAKTSAN